MISELLIPLFLFQTFSLSHLLLLFLLHYPLLHSHLLLLLINLLYIKYLLRLLPRKLNLPEYLLLLTLQHLNPILQ